MWRKDTLDFLSIKFYILCISIWRFPLLLSEVDAFCNFLVRLAVSKDHRLRGVF